MIGSDVVGGDDDDERRTGWELVGQSRRETRQRASLSCQMCLKASQARSGTCRCREQGSFQADSGCKSRRP